LHAQPRTFQALLRAVFLDAGFYISYPYCASRRPVLPVAALCMNVLERFSVFPRSLWLFLRVASVWARALLSGARTSLSASQLRPCRRGKLPAAGILFLFFYHIGCAFFQLPR